MAKKIVIKLEADKDNKAGFKIWHLKPLNLPKVPKMEWHGIAPRFKQDIPELSVRALRQLLSDEKARILHNIALKKPGSVYELAQLLGRDFKAVREDIKLLEQFGLVKLLKEKSGKRQRMRPVLAEEKLEISFRLK